MSANEPYILIVDDDEYLLDIYSMKFREEGVKIDTAVGGNEAIDKISSDEDYDIILLDIIMPKVGGFEVLEQLTEEGVDVDAEIMILSNQGQPDDIKRAEDYGIDEYIVKANAVPSEVVDRVLEKLP
ncbi:MAG: response regulator [Parcubacteria group bacterium SW_4_46_8]|nr:MAG: response regulator [Parcubacteria group bacterium SW_4_46_8]